MTEPAPTPAASGSSGFLDSRPAHRQGVAMVSVPARPGGRSRTYLRDPRSGVSIEAQPWECELWELMTGTRSVRDLLAAGLLSPEPIGPEQLGSALLRFEKAGFLDGSESSRSPGPRLAYAAGLPELGLAGRRAVGTVAALALAAPMAGFWFTLEQLRHTGMGLVFPGVSPLWAVLAAWLFEWFRWACQALTASACGFRLPRAGVDLRILLPLPYLDLSRLELADRRHQVYVALAGLLSPLSAAAALCALKPWTASPVVAGLAAPAAAMALLFVALDASPLFEWNGYRLYRAAFDRELVRDHALAFFARRLFVSAPKDEKPSEEERRLSLYGLAVLAWVVGALRLATGAFRVSSVPLALAIFQAGSIPVQTLLLGMLLLSAGLLGYGVLQVLLVPVALLGERVQKEALSRLTVPAAVLASAAGLLWDSPPVQVLLLALYSLLVIVIWNRSRAAFRGMPMVYGLDLLVLFLGLRAVLLVPWVLLETASPLFGVEMTFGQQTVLEWTGLLLFAAAPFFFRQAAGAGPGRRERILPPLIAAILMAMAFPAVRAGASFGSICTYTGVVAVATAAIQLMFVDGASPVGRIWRLLFAAFVAMAAGASMDLHGIPDEFSRLATLPLYTAGLLPVAAAIFVAGSVLSGPFRGRERESLSATADAAQACRSAAGHLFGTLSELAQEVLGERRARAILADSLWDGAEGDDGALRMGYALRLAALERHGGHAFRAAAEHAATTGLYWLEWEVAHRRILSSTEGDSSQDLAKLLEDVPFFALLRRERREQVAQAMARERHVAGARVLKQGDPGDRFYLVRTGELDVLKLDPGGIERPAARLVAGDCFGELALISEGTRTASVEARTAIELLSLGRREFLALFPEEDGERATVAGVIRHGGFLRRLPMFSKLPPAILSMLAARLHAEQVETGRSLGGTNAAAPRLLLVREGKLRLEPEGGQSMELGEGGSWGERSLFGAAFEVARAVALEPSTVLVLEAADFREVLEGYLRGVRGPEDLARPRGVA